MFASLGLFQKLQCPDKNNCTRPSCIFSHQHDLPPPPTLQITIDESRNSPVVEQSSFQSKPPANNALIPAKRTVTSSPASVGNGGAGSTPEPPRKLQKVGSAQKPVPTSSTSYTSTGVPILKVNAAQSQVAVPVRQAMIKNLYDHFSVLYNTLLPTNPTLAADHALRQEEEVYKKSNKITYRNAVINSIAALKRRSVPDSVAHDSVGTEAEIAARVESRNSLRSLRLTRKHLDALVLSVEDMQKWGYIVEIPEGPGGDRPSDEGKTAKCERCTQPFMVKRREEADECIHHWGRPYTRTINGEKARVYSCCSRLSSTEEGCSKGPHVFYEKKPEDLHARHPFSPSRPTLGDPADDTSSDKALDVVALDCEMIYTTGGMRVARVSVVDGMGAEVLDQLVRMDEGVEVIDYNTRFSGITQEDHAKALLTLSSIRRSLDILINSRTIIIGHALENDLKTLRMIHHQCVDTAILFPHKAGPPYRRALRDLVREHLGTIIQSGGGTTGHSSVEDSIATLDLVRWYILNRPKTKPKPQPTTLSVPGGEPVASS